MLDPFKERGRALASLVAVTLAFLNRCVGQTSNITCIQYQKLDNSKGQTPCLVAAILGNECFANLNIESIPNGTSYEVPAGNEVADCSCNSVFYSLLMGCALCQGGVTVAWSDWIANCPANETNVASYPEAIPSGSAVPGWAYQNVSTNGVFDIDEALEDDSPESTPATTIPSSTVPLTASTSTTASTTSATSASLSAKSRGSSDKGAITGGVVGGAVGLGLIGLLAFLWRRGHLRGRRGGRSIVPLGMGDDASTGAGRMPTLMSEKNMSSEGGIAPIPHLGVEACGPARLYSPEGRSTFPVMPTPSPLGTRPVYQPQNSSYYQAPTTQGAYRGFAEV